MTHVAKGPHHGNLSCSFCGKGQQVVRKLIAGPNVYICDECIALCVDILAGDAPPESPRADDVLAAAARLIRACDSDPRVPRIAFDIVIALGASLRKHLEPRND
jgi:hypothetical protein